MAAVCVFCGARTGSRPAYAEDARQVGELLAARGVELVYGGGSIGLMGVCADAALAGGGRVTGVIPTFLDRVELAHPGLDAMEVTSGMMPRKEFMMERADGFLSLPGGYGTFDELLEVVTWAQLHLHQKPMVVLDTAGFYQPFLSLLDHLVAEGFVDPRNRDLVVARETPEAALEFLGV